jgi:hypothetical protein
VLATALAGPVAAAASASGRGTAGGFGAGAGLPSAISGATGPAQSAGTTPLGGWTKPAVPPAAPATDQVLVVLSKGTSITGPATGRADLAARLPVTSDAAVNTVFARVGAKSIRPLLPGISATQAQAMHAAATAKLGTGALDLSQVEVLQVGKGEAAPAAAALSGTSGVAYAEVDPAVTPMDTGAQPIPAWAGSIGQGSSGTNGSSGANGSAGSKTTKSDYPDGIPTNYGLSTSLESYLNANGLDVSGAYSLLSQRYNQLPGAGETITNVSVGDLTDASMTSNPYVEQYGPTTIVQNGQRYLDIPSMPLIPTYTADENGVLDPTGSTSGVDPQDGEILLDFSTMSPLPHDQQRTAAVGVGDTDLLGIAPGAKYRLVVPTQPTLDQIAVALLAAAQQSPRPNVITASLGIGTDTAGFPGRYLEDDPIAEAVVADIVQQYGITVVISSNDGTRLYTNASIGPDGGSTPTDLAANPNSASNVNDDAYSTTPTEVLDSGAIAAGSTTTDDTMAVPPQNGGAASRQGTWATTRTDGSGVYSSGFGTRIDLSAPGDAIPAFVHHGPTAESVEPVLNGGTSAAAPEIAAAAAVVLQTARLTGHTLTPAQVRSLLESTARTVATPPQIDQPLNVGKQVDVTAAVQSLLKPAHNEPGPQIVRLSIAHRETTGDLGGDYTEVTDPTLIDLSGPVSGTKSTGEGLVGPVTVGADVTGLPSGSGIDYALRVGSTTFTSPTASVRLTPTQILTAAGLPVVSSTEQTVNLTFLVRRHGKTIASTTYPLSFSATSGSYYEAQAPVAPAQVAAGQSVSVSYNLAGVVDVKNPELVVSTVGHWNPAVSPIFSAAATIPLTGTSGTVTVPASAFADGGGIYGIGIIQDSSEASADRAVYGEFASIRVAGGSPAQRPAAPPLATAANKPFGHDLEINRAAPNFAVRYDIRGIKGATGALLEVSAPGPNLYNSYNLVDNPNGTVRDNDGVDSPATMEIPLTGSHGTATFNALTLGLATSENYNVRLLATNTGGTVLGQASPESMLTVDDGLAPGGAIVSSFAIVPGGVSVASTDDPAGGASVYDYNAATGLYGTRLTTDSTSGAVYDVIGVDPGDQHALVAHATAAGGMLLETYDTATGASVGSPVDVGSQYVIGGGRVDAATNSAVVLAHQASTKADYLLPIDLATGAMGTPIGLDSTGATPGSFDLLDLDAATGDVYVQSLNGAVCSAFQGQAPLATVTPTGTVTSVPNGQACASALVDNQSGSVIEQKYHMFSINFPGTAQLVDYPAADFASPTTVAVDSQQPITAAADGKNGVALVAFRYPHLTSIPGGAVFFDNNASSRLVEVNLATGQTTKVISGFEFGTDGFGGDLYAPANQSIQLDPATRTGWTYSPDGTQIQQFAY